MTRDDEICRADIAAILGLCPVVPVITIERVEDAVPLARALVAGGIRVLEVTLRTSAARDAAAAMIRAVPDAVVGLGTVLTAQDLEAAGGIGAHFAVSPGATPELLVAAARTGLPFLPGVQTASELMTALAHGFEIVKLFPALPAGGIAHLRALAGPFPGIRFCPTGGIGAANAAEWLAEPSVVAVGGSWIAPTSDIRQGAWAVITARAGAARALRNP